MSNWRQEDEEEGEERKVNKQLVNKQVTDDKTRQEDKNIPLVDRAVPVSSAGSSQ